MNMSGVVRQEILFFAASVMTGCILLWLYNILLLWRRWVSHKNWIVSLEDFGYWCICALVIFLMIFEKNNGIIRVHAFVGLLIGAWAQWKIQSFFQKFWIKLLKKSGKIGKMAKTDDKGTGR